MAKTMSIIRYKYKADRDFESVQFEGMSCSVGELKRLIIERSSRSGAHHSRDDYDLLISNATTHEEYKDNSEMIPRNTSVVVARRIRGTFESLTPASNKKLAVSSDDIINDYLRPAVLQSTQHVTPSTTSTSSSSSFVESKRISLETSTKSSNNAPTHEISEDERSKEIAKMSQTPYSVMHRSNASYICHNCKQAGHMRNQCPLLLPSSSTNSMNSTTISLSLSDGECATKSDDNLAAGSNSTSKSLSNPSHTATHQIPYQVLHNNNRHHGNRSRHYGSTHKQNESLSKNSTGIPRDDLIQIPRLIPGAYRDRSGGPVISKQMAQLIVEKSEKKADALAQRVRQYQEKGFLPPTIPPSMLSTKFPDKELPPDDLLCPICKKIYDDAVITPCCHNSFCDECIRTALVESEDHECPHCHRQNVAIDQINPNLFLRKHVNRWREEQQHKSSYSRMALSETTPTVNYSLSQTSEQDLDLVPKQMAQLTNTENSSDVDEYETSLPNMQQQPTVPVKTGPIVIKMQPIGRSPSPSPLLSTKPAGMTFEDGRAPDTDQTISSQKDIGLELSATNSNVAAENLETKADTNTSGDEKSDRQTPQLQVAPTSSILSPPSTTTTTSVVPHFYPVSSLIPSHQQQLHHSIMYPQQIPPTSSTGFFPMQHNIYPPTNHIPYSGVHHTVGRHPMIPVGIPPVPNGGLHPYPIHSSLSTGFPPNHHPIIGPSHVTQNPMNGFCVTHFEATNASTLHHPDAAYPAASTSTLITHHYPIASQPITTTLTPTLSKDEFYLKQYHLQRIQRPNSRQRTRSRSSSKSYCSSSSSFSSRDDHHRRHSSHNRNRRRESTQRNRRRTKSPSRNNHLQKYRSTRGSSKQRVSPRRHRSSPYQHKRRYFTSDEKNLSKHRRSSPHSYQPTRNPERCRSPRPPPTIQQSTQRIIVYLDDSSTSRKCSSEAHHRTKSHSRHSSQFNDDRIAPSSKHEEKSQSNSISCLSSMTVPTDQRRGTYLSKTKTVVEDDNSVLSMLNSLDNVQSTKKNSTNKLYDKTAENSSNSDKKRKHDDDHHLHHHHKIYSRHRSRSPSSKSKIRHHSDEDNTKVIANNKMVNANYAIET